MLEVSETTQLPVASSRGLGRVCEILDSVVRALRAEVTRRKELRAKYVCLSLQASVTLINRTV